MGNATQVLEVSSKSAVDVASQTEPDVKPQGKAKAEPGSKPLPPMAKVDPAALAEQDRQKAQLVKQEALRDESANAIGHFETGASIDVYYAIGEKSWDDVYFRYSCHTENSKARKAPVSWTDTNYDNEIGIIRTRCETFYSELFWSATDGRKSGVVAKPENYVLVFLTVKVLRETFPQLLNEIGGLSYHTVLNMISRKMVTFSKTAMDISVKPSWSEFIKVNLPKLHLGREVGGLARGGIEHKEFAVLVKEHEGKMSSAKTEESKAGKTPAQLAKEEKEADARKKASDASKDESKVNSDLSTSLAVALSGGLKPEAIAGIIAKSASDAKVSLDSLRLAPIASKGALDPATCTVKEALSIFKAMYVAERYAELRAISAQLAKMVAVIDADSETEVKLAVAV